MSDDLIFLENLGPQIHPWEFGRHAVDRRHRWFPALMRSVEHTGHTMCTDGFFLKARCSVCGKVWYAK